MKRFLAVMTLFIFTSFVYATTPTDNTIAPMLKKVMPSVVNIQAIGTPTKNDKQPGKLGSGVIIDTSKGYILTNAHVVNGAVSITVNLNDGRHFVAKLIGADEETDIAVLQIKADGLSTLPIGNSDELQVGDFVAAIGTPFGLNKTVTTGIVSALQRDDLNVGGGGVSFENFIQTDAAINPGNSGGALVNFEGQLVGINTAIISQGGGNIGIGFAIPINMALNVADQLIEYGQVKRGLLGIFAQTLTPELAQAFNLSTKIMGVIVTSVSDNSPAAKAGLQVGDIILSINKQPVKDPFQVRNIIGVVRVGSSINIEFLRDGKTFNKSIEITTAESQIEALQKEQPFLSMLTLANINEIYSAGHGVVTGVQVLNVPSDSLAFEDGLMPDDIIVSANGKKVSTIDDLYKAANSNKDRLLLNVIRGNGALFVVIEDGKD